jgi:adhesin/invasin
MVSRNRAIVPLLLLPLALVAACDKVPLLAPTGTVINLFPATTSVSLNSEVTIIATVIENGVASSGSGPGAGTTTRTGSGTPVQNGTVVSFTTTIGRIEPADARTNNGQVNVRLITGNVSGTATITAYSGGASSQTTLKVGTSAVRSILLTASPTTLGSLGGSVLVTATALDEGGGPVGGVPLIFSTDKGTLTPPTTTTDASGVATTTLTTNTTAKVVATAGSLKSNEVTVTVNPLALESFTASPTATSAGVPVTFTVKVAANASVANVRIEYGDGDRDDLGPVFGTQTTVHVYRAAGIYTAKATATDFSGVTLPLTQTIIVGSLPVTLSASNSKPLVGESVLFTVNGIPAGTPVDHFTWTFDDGTPQVQTTGPSLPHTFSTKGIKNVRVDVFGVGGGKIGSAPAQVDVQ